MKKSPCLVLCLAALFAGQLAAYAASTNSEYNLTSVSVFKVSKLKVAETNSATAFFFNDGTAALHVGSYVFSGTWTNKNGKQVTLTPDASGLTAISNNVVALINAQIPEATISVKMPVKFSKIKLNKAGAPILATDTVKGKGSETIAGRLRSKSFSLKTSWIDWEWVSGTSTNF
jgi:hypothetical protein